MYKIDKVIAVKLNDNHTPYLAGCILKDDDDIILVDIYNMERVIYAELGVRSAYYSPTSIIMQYGKKAGIVEYITKEINNNESLSGLADELGLKCVIRRKGNQRILERGIDVEWIHEVY